jgi:hypothetical protein
MPSAHLCLSMIVDRTTAWFFLNKKKTQRLAEFACRFFANFSLDLFQ